MSGGSPRRRFACRRLDRRVGVLLLVLAALASPALVAVTPEQLWSAWPTERFVSTAAPCLRHAELVERLRELAATYPSALRLETVGVSVQGRAIHLASLGRGEREVLLWSQMHGDEPSATPALLDLARFLLTHPEDEDAARILERLTLRLVPMLNPDGAEIYGRRNAQGIDVNRDALRLATPEGRLLKTLRERFEPVLGFNLHDQSRRRAVGDTGALASVAVLAVAGDAAGTMTPGRERAARAGAAVVAALSPFFPGGIARYDDEFSPRAFGDSLTSWGTPVLLIESGGVPSGGALADLTRANFVALLTVLAGLAADDLAGQDLAPYAALPENESEAWSDVVVSGASILQAGAGAAYRADLAFDRHRPDRIVAGCSEAGAPRSRIVEIGDASLLGAQERIEATGGLILAPFEVGVSGWGALDWLDGPGLERLARAGVARVVWSVPKARLDDALGHADAIAGPGRPSLEPTTSSNALPAVVLARLPAEPGSDHLGARLEALLGARELGRSGSADPRQRLALLWNEVGAGAPPPLRPGSPASFSVLAEAADLADARVGATWLEGVEVGGVEP